MPTVAVLGCGLIGSSWIAAFSTQCQTVKAWDPQHSVIQPDASSPIQWCDTPEDAVKGADFVQESVPEDLAVKRELYARLSKKLASHAIVASSSSALLPSDLQAGLSFAERVLVGHPFNPPHLIPLVEVVGGRDTAPSVLEEAIRFYKAIGKHPIRLNVERKGHLANRLQAAVWREAVDAVATGQATVQDVDAAVTCALGPRWALLGPFATFHLGGGSGGLAHFIDHLGPVFEDLWDDAKRPAMTSELKRELIDSTQKQMGGRSVDELTQLRNDRLKSILMIAALQFSPEARASTAEILNP
ncbi:MULTISPECIES: 3-hydroxyacyl-CoA dehydrogenase NAD-binding domain-containing protein [unclassified Bradyrhizobium]|uniref:3-hydroxyacyl-CoA dehydrogenase NAD-binding domain-containing protein n=1 Tax=unclassified Bradyrhizobium TaxID=2631580 RepID=UPI001FFAD45A|nr:MULTISPECIES: 3-hydroxyacyl-CoA dehydrogenase NAD-binding domain-containing protein [unclassified Bradyrhizobium]MCK1712122.1 3-hydroxyacyl-CoA dehydrogenase [Bradyrhizobium sp. 143]MCK1731297.1 3-hydroxyacyl-CoA dehydrogenase [Bradyrhizobium sp. 142]